MFFLDYGDQLQDVCGFFFGINIRYYTDAVRCELLFGRVHCDKDKKATNRMTQMVPLTMQTIVFPVYFPISAGRSVSSISYGCLTGSRRIVRSFSGGVFVKSDR